MLADEIKKQMFSAMKNNETVKKEILRVALGEIQTEAARSAGGFGDAEVVKVLRKLLKSNQESLAAGIAPEQEATLQQENQVLESFLPQQLSTEQIMAALGPVAEEIKAAKADGPAVGTAMKHLKGQGAEVDGKRVAEAVRQLRA